MLCFVFILFFILCTPLFYILYSLAWFSCDMLSVFVNLFLGLWGVCLVLLFLIVVVWVLDLLLIGCMLPILA